MISRKNSGIAGLILFITTISLYSATALVKGPYMILTNQATAVKIMWQLNATAECQIEWGKTPDCNEGSALTTESGAGDLEHQHAYAVTALLAGQKYYYRVTENSVAHTGNFYAPPTSSQDKIKFLYISDSQSYPFNYNLNSESILPVINADPGYQTFLLSAGDQTDSDTEEEWQSDYFNRIYPANLEVQSRLPVMSARSNHHFEAIQYKKYFPYDYQPDGYYYSFDYGPVHFTFIDQYIDYATGSTQLIWLASDLANTTKKWKIVVFHESAYSAGAHENNVLAQTYIQPVLVQHGVQLAITGHNHYYSHNLVNNVHHVTSGGGGGYSYNVSTTGTGLVKAESSRHFLKLKVDGDHLFVEAVRPLGTVIDEFSIDLNGQPATLIANFSVTPIELQASFTDTSAISSGSIVSWLWNFGDGSTSTVKNPSHTYAANGIYAVRLVVTDNQGLADDKSRLIQVRTAWYDDFYGTFPGLGVWQRQSSTKKWSRLNSADATQLSCADFNKDGFDDLLGMWTDPNGLWIRYSTGSWSSRLISTDQLKWMTSGDLNGDGQADFFGSWTFGCWSRDTATGVWQRIIENSANFLTAIDLDLDGKEDVIGNWTNPAGIWARYSRSGNWEQLYFVSSPLLMGRGDMNGDGYLDLIGVWDYGIWYRDTSCGTWRRIYTSPASMVEAGDLDKNGKDDFIGVWPGVPGTWVKYSGPETWEKLLTTNATNVAAGKPN